MTLYLHELKRGRLSLIIWSAALSFMILICILIYPEVGSQMDEMSEMFANMGAFSEAFGMDQLGFGDFLGFFAVECGEVMGIGGAIFAALMGISALSKEEKDKTAEFLLTHPISRTGVVFSKLTALLTQILILNLAVGVITALGILIIGEEPDGKKVFLLLLSYLILQVEIACVTFGLSAAIRSKGIGIGIGLAMALYFLSILANITNELEFLKWITPFTYTEGAYIVENVSLDWKYVAVGAVLTAGGIVLAFLKYRKKDIL
ncbi:MAG: ABC transporter permease subunit [Clostridia bacterium]|nr:ABC transporter permease subunit [Clostridia bacterium]